MKFYLDARKARKDYADALTEAINLFNDLACIHNMDMRRRDWLDLLGGHVDDLREFIYMAYLSANDPETAARRIEAHEQGRTVGRPAPIFDAKPLETFETVFGQHIDHTAKLPFVWDLLRGWPVIDRESLNAECEKLPEIVEIDL